MVHHNLAVQRLRKHTKEMSKGWHQAWPCGPTGIKPVLLLAWQQSGSLCMNDSSQSLQLKHGRLAVAVVLPGSSPQQIHWAAPMLMLASSLTI
jgi:hypothetical protein